MTGIRSMVLAAGLMVACGSSAWAQYGDEADAAEDDRRTAERLEERNREQAARCGTTDLIACERDRQTERIRAAGEAAAERRDTRRRTEDSYEPAVRDLGPAAVSGQWTTLGTVRGLRIEARTLPGPTPADAAIVDWRITNLTDDEKWLSGTWVAEGTPVSGTLSSGRPAGRGRGTGALPQSRIRPHGSRVDSDTPEVVHLVHSLTVHVDNVYGPAGGSRSAE